MGSLGTILDTLVAPDSIDLGIRVTLGPKSTSGETSGSGPSLAPDSIDLATPERTSGELIFRSLVAPDSIDLGPRVTKRPHQLRFRTHPTSRAGGQDDGSYK